MRLNSANMRVLIQLYFFLSAYQTNTISCEKRSIMGIWSVIKIAFLCLLYCCALRAIALYTYIEDIYTIFYLSFLLHRSHGLYVLFHKALILNLSLYKVILCFLIVFMAIFFTRKLIFFLLCCGFEIFIK